MAGKIVNGISYEIPAGRFVCIGSVRGDCGHYHRTVQGAVECLERDRKGCSRQGGYSDRRIYDDLGRAVETVSDGACVYAVEAPRG